MVNADWLAAWAAILTALFTGYTAWQGRQDRKRRVEVEWEQDWYSSSGECRIMCRIKNQSGSTLKVERATVTGPVRDLQIARDGRAQDKHPSWGKADAPVSVTILEGQDGRFSLLLFVDPQSSREAAVRSKSSARSKLAKWAWQLGHFRLPIGVKFSIKVIAYRSSSTWRPIRLTHTIRVYADTVIKMAETIEKNAADS